MNLVSTEAVRTALGFEDMTDINTAIETILPAVTAYMEVSLDTRFSLATAQDVYYVPPYKAPDNGHVETKLRLRNGFIMQDTLIVTTGDSPSELDANPRMVLNMQVRSYADIEKGILLDYKTAYVGSTRRIDQLEYLGGPYIRVSYTYGFDQDSSDPKLFDQSRVPDWLKEAAVLKAKIFLSDHPVLKNAEATQNSGQLEVALRAVLLSHLRFSPGSLVPM